MADNRMGYGFRYAGNRWGGDKPTIVRLPVATAASFDVTGGTANVLLGPGDPVARLSTGGVGLCPGAETTLVVPYGIVASVGPYYDGTVMSLSGSLPSDTAWTGLERQSTVGVIPIETAYWEIDCAAATGTTKAAYQAFCGENTDFRLYGGIAPTANPQNRAHPRLDMSAHAVTDSLTFRIVRVSDTMDNVDFTGLYVKMIVEINITGVSGAAGLNTVSKGI